MVGRVDAGQQECCWNLFKGRLHDTGRRRRGALRAKRSQTVKDLFVGLGQDPLRSKVEEQGVESEKERAGGMPGQRSCEATAGKKECGGAPSKRKGALCSSRRGSRARGEGRGGESDNERRFLHVHQTENKLSEERAGPQCWTSANV